MLLTKLSQDQLPESDCRPGTALPLVPKDTYPNPYPWQHRKDLRTLHDCATVLKGTLSCSYPNHAESADPACLG